MGEKRSSNKKKYQKGGKEEKEDAFLFRVFCRKHVLGGRQNG